MLFLTLWVLCCLFHNKQTRTQQGAKKVIFTACHSGKLQLTFTSPSIISTSPKNVLMSRLISQFFCNLNSSKNITCPSGKLKTEFTSPIAKFTSPGLSNTTFFARCSAPLGLKLGNEMFLELCCTASWSLISQLDVTCKFLL